MGTSRHDATAPLSDHYRSGDTGYSGAYVDRGASGEILRRDSQILESCHEESAAPDHVGHRRIDAYGPESEEQEDRRESDPLRSCTEHYAGSYDCEHSLEQHELRSGDVSVPFGNGCSDSEHRRKITDEHPVSAQCQRIAYSPPDEPDKRHDANALGHHGCHALLSQHAAVEQSDCRSHYEYQHRAQEHVQR